MLTEPEVIEGIQNGRGNETPFRIVIVEYKGSRKIEIRQMYRKASTGDALHFGKGIRIPLDSAKEVLETAISHRINFLEPEEDPTTQEEE